MEGQSTHFAFCAAREDRPRYPAWEAGNIHKANSCDRLGKKNAKYIIGEINQSISQLINQSISKSINQSFTQSINQSVNQSSNQSINQTINQ